MLTKPQAFFDACRVGLLGPSLSTSEVDGLVAITNAMDGTPLSHAAYALGTAYLETNHTMQPIKELGGRNYFMRMYDKTGSRPHVATDLGNTEVGDGALFAGRGYVQLTGRRNYAKADCALELQGRLMGDPDLAMRPDIAAKIMRHGMVNGWFTTRKLSDYLPSAGEASIQGYVPARRIINGSDRAQDVAEYAYHFQSALRAGGWA